ncbi:hypothetical protein ES702_02771 [subsurface metagenome]
MEGLISLLAIGLSICLIMFFGDLWKEKKHGYLKFGVSAFVIILLVLLAKVPLDFDDHCDFVVNQSVVSGSSTTYTYNYECGTKSETTNLRFYQAMLWFQRLVITYAALFALINFFQIKLPKWMLGNFGGNNG